MNEQIKQIFRTVEEAHMKAMQELLALEQSLPEDNMVELADHVYALRESESLADALRIKIGAIKSTCEKLACLLYVVTPNSGGTTIRTEFCTGKPDLKMGAQFPSMKRDKEGYLAVTDFLNVPRELAEKDVFRPHWPGFIELLSDLMTKGMPLPPGIDPNKTYPIYKLTVTRKKHPLE